MWAIFPLQDLLAMDDRPAPRQNPHDEQINVPSNPTHFWKYRLHLNLEDLTTETSFRQQVQDLVGGSGRSQVY